ncbi:MAG: hypothetical protein M1379_09025 [Firmicutes bacterium]|nr:hypothetical protein [Bacillota bacterium]
MGSALKPLSSYVEPSLALYLKTGKKARHLGIPPKQKKSCIAGIIDQAFYKTTFLTDYLN